MVVLAIVVMAVFGGFVSVYTWRVGYDQGYNDGWYERLRRLRPRRGKVHE